MLLLCGLKPQGGGELWGSHMKRPKTLVVLLRYTCKSSDLVFITKGHYS